MNNKRIIPPKSWKKSENHFLSAIESEWYAFILELQNEINWCTHEFYRKKYLKTLFLPVTTNSISSPMGLGSDSLPVEINLFNQTTYLADSMQFMLEYGCRFFDGGCYYLMPSFRGEKADERHLCQFYHSEAEIKGYLEDVIGLVEEYLVYLSECMLRKYGNTIAETAGTLEHAEKLVLTKNFERIKYSEAVKILSDKKGCLKKDGDFIYITSKGERQLIKQFNGAVWLTHMDKRIVPFYQTESPDGYSAECADLLMGIGETIGAGERHKSGEEVKSALSAHKIPIEDYDWYIKMKDNYPLKTSGFGMGTERYILWLLSHDDIRDCQLLPRFNGEKFVP